MRPYDLPLKGSDVFGAMSERSPSCDCKSRVVHLRNGRAALPDPKVQVGRNGSLIDQNALRGSIMAP